MLLVLSRSQSHVCSLTVPCTEVEELDVAEPRVLRLSLLVPPIAALPCSPLCKVDPPGNPYLLSPAYCQYLARVENVLQAKLKQLTCFSPRG